MEPANQYNPLHVSASIPCQGPSVPMCAPEEDARSLLFQRAYELEQEAAGLRIIASTVPTAGVLGWDARVTLLAAAKSIAGKGK